MSAHATFDLSQGLLRLSRPTLAVLRARWRGADHGEPDADEHIGALRKAGVIRRRGVHPEVEAALAPMEQPACELEVRESGRLVEGWMSREAVTFVYPASEDLVDVAVMHPSLVPWSLASLVGLEPRPRPEVAIDLLLAREDIERLLTARTYDPDAVRGSSGDEPAARVARAAEGIVAGLRGRWRAEARWVTPGGRPGGRVVEVIDTDSGLWLVEPGESEMKLRAITPTFAWRLLINVPPWIHEVDPDSPGARTGARAA